MSEQNKQMKSGDRVKIIKPPIGESKKLIGREAVVDGLMWVDTFADITVVKRPRERKTRSYTIHVSRLEVIK